VVYETTGSVSTSYVLAGSKLISQTQNGSTSFYLQDGQGSTRNLTDSTGNVTDSYSYTAFGEIYSQTGTTENKYLYTGQQYDAETNLYSLRARYYNPSNGRFLSQDKYAVNFNNPIELNRYGYAANSPINLSDPSGNNATKEYDTALTPAKVIGALMRPAATPLIVYVGSPLRFFIIRGFTIAVAGASPLWLILLQSLLGIETGISIGAGIDAGRVPATISVPRPQPTQAPVPTVTVTVTPTKEPKSVRVRHYSNSINSIKSQMLIRSTYGFSIWVEYPIFTSYEESEIRETVEIFGRDYSQITGFVEFDVDLEKWTMVPDPNLKGIENAKMILTYVGNAFPLNEPGVNPMFFDKIGNPLP
jgi:RHS repeat-associated protein